MDKNALKILGDDKIEVVDSFKAEEEKQRKIQLFVIFGIIGLALLFLIAVLIYVAKKKSELKKLQEEERKKFEELIPEFEEITLGEQLTAEDQERREKEEQIKQIARERPEEVANLLRTWMNEE
jgi:flagellar M-ring protein FliF